MYDKIQTAITTTFTHTAFAAAGTFILLALDVYMTGVVPDWLVWPIVLFSALSVIVVTAIVLMVSLVEYLVMSMRDQAKGSDTIARALVPAFQERRGPNRITFGGAKTEATDAPTECADGIESEAVA